LSASLALRTTNSAAGAARGERCSANFSKLPNRREGLASAARRQRAAQFWPRRRGRATGEFSCLAFAAIALAAV
jgi:hypothetical protein